MNAALNGLGWGRSIKRNYGFVRSITNVSWGIGWRQGCQMVCFQTKNPYLGKHWRALDWKMLIYCMSIWNILRTFGLF
jgi:hypothetical protein